MDLFDFKLQASVDLHHSWKESGWESQEWKEKIWIPIITTVLLRHPENVAQAIK